MKKKDLIDIRLAGFGGQGLVTAGKTLAKAIAYGGDYNVCFTKSYGPESRGGAARSEVIISKNKIFYPKPEDVDILIAMSQTAYDKFKDEVKDDVIVIVDADLVKCEDKDGLYKVAFTKIASEDIGIKVVANIVALGVLYGLVSDIIDKDHLVKAIKLEVPRGTEEINIKAFEAGIAAIQKLG